MSVSVVDYGVGNLGSVVNMFRKIGAEVRIITSPTEVTSSDRILLPGVGAFDRGMSQLAEQGWTIALQDFAATNRPLMGICLGMQLLLDSSEEGDRAGLGLIPGVSRKFESMPGLRIPHMGWNSIAPQRDDPLLDHLDSGSRFYFVHSYRVVTERPSDTLALSIYGQEFASMIRSGNVMGAQFHPEKSHTFGMTLLKNFSRI